MRLLLVFVFIGLIPGVSAEAKAYKFQCEYDLSCSDADGCKAASFGVEFNWDDNNNDAFIVGNQGISPVFPFVGSEAISFTEPLEKGGVHIAVVEFAGASVYSRHIVINRSIIATQYYGNCNIEGQ